jgi:hypothetical protein
MNCALVGLRISQGADSQGSREYISNFQNPLGSFCFWNRTRREIALAPFSTLEGVPTVYAPYLDNHLFDFINCPPAYCWIIASTTT